MSRRDLRRHAGRFAIVGFVGETVPSELRQLAAEFDLGGVIYFARNIAEPAQVAELSREIAALATDWPLWISVDQEGGRVARLRAPFTEWPPASTIGRSGDEALAARFGRALGAELRAVGINLDYAPVLDVHTNPANPVIGDRALADRAADVARLGAAIIGSLQEAGVAACGKHFPGHGDTRYHSHLELPIVEHDRRRLDEIELVPFRRAIAAGVATMMTAHIMVPAIDRHVLASFSRVMVNDLLKIALGYDGIVLSDDLGMKAVSASAALPEATVQAIAAGCDMVLMCNSTTGEQVEAIEAIIRAGERGDLDATRIDDAMRRQHRVKTLFLGAAASSTPMDVVGCQAHATVAREMASWL